MIQLTEDGVFAIAVPYITYSAFISNDTNKLIYYVKDFVLPFKKQLPVGESYKLLFTTNTVDEEKAKIVVEVDAMYPNNFFKDYGGKDYEVCTTATESFKSLLASKGIKEGNYAIVKKVKL